MTKKLLPFINKFDGEVRILTKSQGKNLSEDWARAKVVTNDQGERVFRFQLSTEVVDVDGKKRPGIATVDISENEETKVVADGNGNSN